MIKIIFFLCFYLLISLQAKSVEFIKIKDVQVFIDELVTHHSFQRAYLENIFKHVSFKPSILKIYNTPINRYKTDASWVRYKTKIITNKKISDAKRFMHRYKTALNKAEKKYHVPKKYITAFIAIETNFGKITGKSNILNALSSLSFFKNRKQKFFKNELKELFLLAQEKQIQPNSLYGSFAGAMGCVQQLPSVHRKYGVDFNNDGDKNPFDMVDCIGTIANFLHTNNWDSSQKVVIRAHYKGKRYKGLPTGYNKIYTPTKLKLHHIIPTRTIKEHVSLLQIRDKNYDQLWLGLKNFRVLTKYNHSTNYAMAIYKIAKMLR